MLQLNFKKVTLHNFGSYADATVELSHKGFCLVSGKNLCPTDNAESNGSGKSFIWSGICYALTGETIKGNHAGLKNNMVDDNEMWVELEFTADGSEYMIRRGTAPSKTLSIKKDDVDVSGKTYTETVTKLSNYLPELTKDLISSCIIVGQGMPNKFSSFSPSGRKELLEKLTKADFMIEDIKTRIGTRSKELADQMKNYEDNILVSTTQLDIARANLERDRATLANAVKPDFDGMIKASNDKLAAINAELANATNALQEAEKLTEATSSELLAKTNEKAANLSSMTEAYNAANAPRQVKLAELNSEIKSLGKEITRLKSIKDVCPTCGQKLVGVEKPDTTALEADLANKNAEVAGLNATLADALNKYNEYKAQIDANFQSDINNLNSRATSARQAQNEAKSRVTLQTAAKQAEESNLTKINYDKEHFESWKANLEKTVADNALALTQKEDMLKMTLEAKDVLASHIAALKKIDTLSKRDFRGYLLTNIIAYIDRKAKDFADTVFGSRELNVYLDGNALDISWKNKMIDNLSGGEATRVDLILQLTIRDMLQNYLGFNSNILVLDEITDFLDKKSCKAVMSLLEKELMTVESVFVISHHAAELELPVDSELNIEKGADGISKVK